LVRPDVYVGWRAASVSADAAEQLLSAMAAILALPAEVTPERTGKIAAETDA